MKEFYEEYGLYQKYVVKEESAGNLAETFARVLSAPSLNLYCPNCKTIQTFNRTANDYCGLPNAQQIQRETFRCSGNFCTHSFTYYFVYLTERDGSRYIVKVGQYPPFRLQPITQEAKALGDHVDDYVKGLACEKQAFGVGAYAYYRRIVEELIDNLLDRIPSLMSS